MKLLKTITHPDYPTPGIETHTREAARVVLVDEDGMIPMIYSRKYDVYKIPGWGIDEWEIPEIAAKREAIEEVWCSSEILWEIGEIIDNRPAYIYKKWVNLKQTSYCFYGKVLDKREPSLTQSEREREFEIIWCRADEILARIDSCKPKTEREEISMKRDRIIFEEYLKLRDK